VRGGFGKGVWKTISSFTNSPEGGYIVYGIEEKNDGVIKIVGGLDVANLQDRIRSFCIEEMQNALLPEIATLEYKGKVLVVAKIQPQISEHKPCYYKNQGLPDGACVRVGNSDQVISFDQMKEFVKNSAQFKFDITKAEGTDVTMLSMPAARAFFEKSALRAGRGAVINDDLKILKNLKLINSFSGELAPTVAGFLIFASDSPQAHTGFSRYVVRCVRYAGDSVASPIVDKMEVVGVLGDQIDQVHAFVMRNIPLRAKLKGSKRVETFAYPEEAIREIVANAIVHRDYQVTETYTQINVFSNRIEVSNAGNLPPGVTIRNIKDAQFSRNEVIASTLKDMEYMEEYGRGIDLVYARMREGGLLDPLFKNTANTFRVTLLGDAFSSVSESQVLIWQYLQTNEEKITAAKCLEILPERSRPSINLDLTKLVESGLIEKKGSGRSTFYQAVF
jgi:ATP-dependent DNA helicase RecG